MPWLQHTVHRVAKIYMNQEDGQPYRSFARLLLLAFALSLCANTLFPLIPFLLDALNLSSATVQSHAAYLNAVFMLSSFLAAPAFGHISDIRSRRFALRICLGIFTLSLYVLVWSSSLPALYLSRLLAGIGAGAVVPVLLAHVSERYPVSQRVRLRAIVITASMAGALAGPYLGSLLMQSHAWDILGDMRHDRVGFAPILTSALISTAILIFTFAAPRAPVRSDAFDASGRERRETPDPRFLYLLFAFSFIVTYGLGTLETGLSTIMRATLQLDAAQLGLMYAECALVMLLGQICFFSTRFKNFANRFLLVPAVLAAAIGLLVFPGVGTFSMLAGIMAVIAGSVGIITPLISLRLAQLSSRKNLGKTFGLLSAASSLGQAAGSAGSSLLFSIDGRMPFWAATAILTSGFAVIFSKIPSSAESDAAELAAAGNA